MIRSSQSSYETKLIQLSQTNPTVLYRYMSSKLNNRSDITQLQKPDGTMTQSDVEAAEELNNFLKSTFTLEDLDSHIPTISARISKTLSYQKKLYFTNCYL